ncbi:MAG: DUF1924 domain-containing protein [Rhodospirillaceae bacterium]
MMIDIMNDIMAAKPSLAPLAPSARSVKLVMHALLSGAFLVAYATGDEDTYAMHLASGYLLLVVLTLRVGSGIAAGRGSVLQLPRPGRFGDIMKRPWSAMSWLTILLLFAIGVAGITGIFADQLPRSLVGRLHEGLGEFAMIAALAHMLFAGALWLRGQLAGVLRTPRHPAKEIDYMVRNFVLMLAATTVVAPAFAGPAQDLILETYLADSRRVDPSIIGFSSERGRTFYLGPHSGGQSNMTSCAACHMPDPTRVGKHIKTGREIDPMAVSASHDRFTDPAKVEKRFSRDCHNVLGRDCTNQEKGDFILFLSRQ